MPSTRVFIQTSLLVSLCAAFPAQSGSQNESKFSSNTSGNASSAPSNGKKRIAVIGLPAAAAQSSAARAAIKPPAQADIARAAARAVGKSYPSNSLERGLYLKQQGQLKPALLEFIKSAHEDPRQVRAFYEQAQIFKQLGNTKLAKSALEQALAISPSYTDARTMLVQTHLESGNLIGVANEVGKLFNLGQERPKREAPSYLAYQSAPSAAIQIANGKFPKASDHSNLTISSANEVRNESASKAEDKATGEESKPVSDETSEWLNSAIKSAETAQPRQSTESDTTEKTNTVSAEKLTTDKSTADILASLGIQPSQNLTSSSTPAKATSSSSSAETISGEQAVEGVGIIGRMRARTGQAISSVQRISKSNIETMKKISHVPHIPVPKMAIPQAVPHMALPQWVKDVRKHIPFMTASEEQPADVAEAPKEGLKEQAASLMSWMKERLPVSSKEKENKQLAEKMKSAMDSANKGPALSPEVAKAIEAKLGITKPAESKNSDAKGKKDEKAPLYSPEMAKAIEAKLAQVKAAEIGSKTAETTATAKADTPNTNLAEQDKSKKTEALAESKGKVEEPKLQLVQLVPQESGQSQFRLSEQSASAEEKANSLQDISAVFADDVFEYNKNSLNSAAAPPDATSKPSEEKTEIDSVKQVLASLGVKSDPEAESSNVIEVGEKPTYGLLGNTALKHINTLPLPSSEKRPSFFDSIWKQAGNTFASMIPKIDWKLPTIDTATLLNNKQAPSAALIAATTDPSVEVKQATPEIHKQLTELSNTSGSAPPTPVPLDISRILNKLGPAPQPVAMSPIAPPLSASIPIAAPVNIDRYIPMPKPQEAPAQNLASLPQVMPQGLKRANQNMPIGPRSTPQATSAQQLPNLLPPVMQQVWDQAQPILQPAMKAASNFAETFAPGPLSIPKNEGAITAPVDMKSAPLGPNNAPTPIGADMKQYFENQMIPVMPPQAASIVETEQAQQVLTKTGGREIVSAARAKNGAFTFMKPVMDSDSSFLLGAKQVRTIQPLPAKAPPPKPAPPPEDAITKRMRYLMENGTSNLRQGEAFMFSEETGEGILFLPGGTERRKLTPGKNAEEVLRTRRPDIAQPRDLQYSLQLLGKLMPTQNGNQQQQQQPAIQGPSLDQLMNQMNQGQRSVWGWMKDTFKL